MLRPVQQTTSFSKSHAMWLGADRLNAPITSREYDGAEVLE